MPKEEEEEEAERVADSLIQGSLTDHVDDAIHHGTGQHCSPISTTHKKGLKLHASSEHEGDLECQKSTSEEVLLNVKGAEDPAEVKKPFFQCDQCSYSTTRRGNLNEHVMCVHKNSRAFPCPQCSYSAKTKSSLKTHMKSMHEREKKFNCQQCSYSTNASGAFKEHAKMIHGEVFRCQQCDYVTSSRGRLNKHKEFVHDKPKEFPCEKCDYLGATRLGLERHKRAEHPPTVKTFSCQQCSYISNKSTILKTHIKIIHDKVKDFHCQQCSYSSSLKVTLQYHIKTVHDKVRDFACQQCSYTTTTRGNLKMHIKGVHDMIRDLYCQHCNYTTHCKSTLKKHLKIHTVPEEEPSLQDVLASGGVANGGDINVVEDKPKMLDEYNCVWCLSDSDNVSSADDEKSGSITASTTDPNHGNTIACRGAEKFSKEAMEAHLMESHCLTLQEYLEMNDISFRKK